MKPKTITYACCFLIATTLILNNAFATVSNSADGQRVALHEIPTNPQEAPRSTVPFEAEYNDVLNCVVLTCITPCGDVAVTLASTAGDWYQTVFDTLDGSILIPTSGDSGDYTLTLVTSDGTTYVGEFCI